MGKRASSIELSNEEREYLELQTRARTIQAQTVARARILLLRADSVSIDASTIGIALIVTAVIIVITRESSMGKVCKYSYFVRL